MIHVDNKNGVKETDPVIIHNTLSFIWVHLPKFEQFLRNYSAYIFNYCFTF